MSRCCRYRVTALALGSSLEAIENYDDEVLGVVFGDRMQLVADHAHGRSNHSEVDVLVCWAGIRHSDADRRGEVEITGSD